MKLRIVLGLFSLSMSLFGGVIVFQDFESGLGPNETAGGAFAINNSNAQINNGTMMMGHAGTYSNDEYSYYQIQVDLAGNSSVMMSFDYRGIFETHFDRFNVLAGTGLIAPPSGLLLPTATSNMQFINLDHAHQPNLGIGAYDTSSPSGGQSGVANFDLSAFAGQVTNIRFQFGSDGSATGAGFAMDNLLIEGDAVPEPSAFLLAGAGLLALAMVARRRRT